MNNKFRFETSANKKETSPDRDISCPDSINRSQASKFCGFFNFELGSALVI